ncbi:uncharacterized protein LOC141914307 [Tubulanus polymorphus]|uniref:uncharacterized protein LOC141914307 n=1 Tax=Tubulanus polymorphus TaxID=672921 RepID=UPI003DA56B26
MASNINIYGLALVSIALFSMIAVSDAVECFECKGDTSKPDGALIDGDVYTKDCLDPFNAKSTSMKKCNDRTQGGQKQECMKLLMVYGGTTYVVRQCIKDGECVNNRRMTDLGTHIATCCKGNDCNAATYMSAMTLSTFALTIIAIFTARQ